MLPAPAAAATPAPLEVAHDSRAFTLVQSARLIERAASAEMRVGVQTPELGKIEVHASLRDNGVGATLSVERPDIQRMFAVELPSLNRALDRHHVELRSVSLMSPMNDGTGGQDSGQQPAPQRQSWPQADESHSGAQSARPSPSAVAAVGASRWEEGRVNLRA
jgi:flagellar hook-length control protein FliK